MSYDVKYAYLSDVIYDVKAEDLPRDALYQDPSGSRWKLVHFEDGGLNGYQGGVFVNVDTNEVVLANRGTSITSPSDVATDLIMSVGLLPSQFDSAKAAYNAAVDFSELLGYGPANVTVTGHSLGGSIAQYLGALNGCVTETFNAYGIGNVLEQNNIQVLDPSKITNHVLDADYVSSAAGSSMLGTTLNYRTGVDAFYNSLIGKIYGAIRPSDWLEYLYSAHKIENFVSEERAAQSGTPVTIDVTPASAWHLSPQMLQVLFAINPLVGLAFATAMVTLARRDPLTLDLDGDGLETMGIDPSSPILFDHDGDGVATATGWIKPDDAFLVLDRDGNGTIDNGTELFGDSTPVFDPVGTILGKAEDGFAALAQEDTNGDGKVDAEDARFHQLRIWQDLNGDGVSQANELRGLEEAGIIALNAGKTEHSRTLANGNLIADLGSFVRSDGSAGGMGAVTAQMGDIDLAENAFFSRFSDSIPLTPEAQGLPDMGGSGLVRRLREAVSLSPELAEVVSRYALADSRADQMALLDELLVAWGRTSSMPVTGDGAYGGLPTGVSVAGVAAGSVSHEVWLSRLQTLERFNGQAFANPGENATSVSINLFNERKQFLDQAWQTLRQSVYDGLLLQTRLRPYVTAIGLSLEPDGLHVDFAATASQFQSRFDSGPAEAVRDLLDFQRIAGAGLNALGWDGYGLLQGWLVAESTPDIARSLADFGYADLHLDGQGTAAAEVVTSAAETGPLSGGGGNDLLLGGQGDDLLHGGAGKDILAGGQGDDGYRFQLGDGDDLIVEGDGDEGSDVLAFGPGMRAGDLAIGQEGDRLVFTHVNGTDRIGIANWFGSLDDAAHRLDRVEFADGRAFALNNIVFGAVSGDHLQGSGADDILLGRAGADVISGGAGNDWLDGGEGADHMLGGAGDDTYVVDHSGEKVWEEADAGLDTVESKIPYTLGDHLEHLILSGTAAVDGAGNALDNHISGNEADNILLGFGGNDILHGGGGSDRLDGGDGADVMAAGRGDDLYLVDTVDDQVIELAGEGTDSVESSVTCTLGAHVEHLHLTGAEAVDGTGNALANVISGNAGSNTLMGLEGDDRLDGGGGADVLIGGEGNDTYLVDEAGDQTVEHAGEGVDHVVSGLSWALDTEVENLTLMGDAAIDGTGNELANHLVGNGAANALYGLAGDDVLDGQGGGDTLVGGAGNDRYRVDDAAAAIVELAGEGVDEVSSRVSWTLGDHLEHLTLAGKAAIDGTGNALDNRLVGNQAANVLKGLDGDDVLAGEAGDDLLDGGGGADAMSGGTGDDAYFIDSGLDQTIETAGAGTDTVFSTLSWTLAGHLENLTLTGSGALDGTGNELDNQLIGNGASNRLYGLDGDDWLDGGMAEDVLAGGLGDDTYVVDLPADKVVEYAGEGNDTVLAGMNYTLRANLENLTLTGERDSQGRGNELSNVMIGNAGDNVLEGRAGDDTLSGGVGNDRIEGGTGDDLYRFARGDGQDTIIEASEAGSWDQLLFGEGIGIDQLWFRQEGGDLEVSLIGGDDRVSITGWYDDPARRVESFATADGQILLDSQVQVLVDAMAAFAPPSAADGGLPPSYQAQLTPVLAASWQ
jgi:Ca2+-binding RTX toxin-like protein